MSERAPYSRIYWSVVDDPKFTDVIDDDRAWALWTRLLMAADQAWPASPTLPMTTNKRALALLARSGIVDLQSGNRFRIHGLDAERLRRKEAATRTPTGTQQGPNRGPVAIRTTALDETRRDETHRATAARAGLPNTTPDVERTWEKATGVSVIGSGEFAIKYLDDACRRHPTPDVVKAILDARRGFERIPSTQQLTAAVRAILDPLPDSRASKAIASEQREADAGRRRVQATKRRNHDIGWHADEPDPMCDACRAVA